MADIVTTGADQGVHARDYSTNPLRRLPQGDPHAPLYNHTMSLALPILDDQPQRPTFARGPRSLDAVKLLRISLTDRCNLRCLYCMPDEGMTFAPSDDVLSADHVVAVAAAARSAGVTHFKLTGGEPTLRTDLEDIVRRLAALKPVELSMTTNGLKLGRGGLAQRLAHAGLDRVTVSLDALDEPTFAQVTGGRGFKLADVWRGLDAAQAAGLGRLKLNVVVIGGVNNDQVAQFAALTHTRPWTVRFIEYMPLGESHLTHRGADAFTVDNADIRAAITAEHGPLEPLTRDDEPGVGPAEIYRLRVNGAPAPGRLGFISAMSQPFCETCNRLRLTATGQLRACLFDGGEVDLMPTLRTTDPRDLASNPSALQALMATCVSQKPEVHSGRGNRAMSQLGG